MSEKKRFEFYSDEYLVGIIDTASGKKLNHFATIELLNKLNDENERLRQMIKENVLGRYAKGSFADLEFKAIAYDDIIKLERSNESEPKLIVICKRGKKDNVQSFCRVFIPHEVYYEIKELEE